MDNGNAQSKIYGLLWNNENDWLEVIDWQPLMIDWRILDDHRCFVITGNAHIIYRLSKWIWNLIKGLLITQRIYTNTSELARIYKIPFP